MCYLSKENLKCCPELVGKCGRLTKWLNATTQRLTCDPTREAVGFGQARQSCSFGDLKRTGSPYKGVEFVVRIQSF